MDVSDVVFESDDRSPKQCTIYGIVIHCFVDYMRVYNYIGSVTCSIISKKIYKFSYNVNHGNRINYTTYIIRI